MVKRSIIVQIEEEAMSKTTEKKEKALKAEKVEKVFDPAAEEKRLREKYPNAKIVHGSVQDICTDKNDPHYNKRTVEIKCSHPGCHEVRRIATSDLHQVKFCEEHTKQYRLEKRRIERAAKRDKKAK